MSQIPARWFSAIGFLVLIFASTLPLTTHAQSKLLDAETLAPDLDLVPLDAAIPPSAPSVWRFLRWTGLDALAYTRTVGSTLPLMVVGGATLVSTTSLLDEPIGAELKGEPGGVVGAFLDAGNRLGERRAIVPAAALFGATLFTDNTRLQDAAFTSFQSALYACAVGYSLKAVIGRARPYTGDGAFGYEPFSPSRDYYSFPSGHTTMAFALVTPWVVYYPGPVTYGLLGLSTGTAIARVAHDEHWATDVLAGAAIGAVTGVFLARRHLSETEAREAVRVQPLVSAEHVGASVTIPIR
ncbi:MAG: phosphatase PAP2 family protein [Bacteroidota bacterium]